MLNQQRKPYCTPVIIREGTVAEMTQNRLTGPQRDGGSLSCSVGIPGFCSIGVTIALST
jgi:hypothetical protein